MVEMSVGQIKRKIKNYDSGLWYSDIQRKCSLRIYRKFKREIRDDRIYDNTIASELLFRARSNTLALDIDKRHRGEETRCEICDGGEEDLQHFMLECRTLEEKRDQEIMIKHWSPDKEEMIGGIIFDGEKIEKVKNMIAKMWQKRKIEIKKKENIRRQIRENIQRRNEGVNNLSSESVEQRRRERIPNRETNSENREINSETSKENLEQRRHERTPNRETNSETGVKKAKL